MRQQVITEGGKQEQQANDGSTRAQIEEKIRAIKAQKLNQKSNHMGQEKKVLAVLFLTLVLDLLAFTCILPLFPGILDYYSGKTEKDSLYSEFDQILISFRRVIGAPDVARFNSVFFGGTSITDHSGVERSRGHVRNNHAQAVIGISFSVGFIVGPIIGAFFASKARTASVLGDAYFFSTPAYFAVTLTVLQLICIWVFMPETLEKKNRVIFLHNLNTLQQIGTVYFLYLFIYSGLEFTLTFFTHLRFSYDSMHQGRMYLFAGVLMAAVQGGYVRRIPAGNQRKAAQWGLGFIIPAYIIIGLATNHFLLYTGLSFYALASGIVVPCLTAVVSSFGSEKEKGTIMGVFRSLGALARAFGPLVASAGAAVLPLIFFRAIFVHVMHEIVILFEYSSPFVSVFIW